MATCNEMIKKEACTGCNACINVCPTRAVTMERDREGFWYPSIKRENCMQCEKCADVCPVVNANQLEKNHIGSLSEKRKPLAVYAAWSLDREIRYHSTSGGIFSELALSILSDGGHVCGAAYDSEHMVKHICIDQKQDLEMLRQSKYVQSDMGDIYQTIESLLTLGEIILFCGSPCQCAGVFYYCQVCNVDMTNLYLVDFICRGANSPKVYRKFLDEMEEQHQSKVKRVWFKNKIYSWNRFSTKIEFENGDYYLRDRYQDAYVRGYIEENLFIRPSCAECKFKGFQRLSDLVLADFWGIQLNDDSHDSDDGTSLVMICTKKGQKLWNLITSRIYKEEKSLEEAAAGNVCLYHSVQQGIHRKQFMADLDVMSVTDNIIRFLTKSKQEKICMIKDLEIIKNCDSILKNKIVLYGDGYCGKNAASMLQKLGIPIEAVCITERKETASIKGIRYISLPELKELDDKENLLIVIATIVHEFVEQIMETLDQHQIMQGTRVTYLGLCNACLLNQKIDKDGKLAYERDLWRMWDENNLRSDIYRNLWKGIFEDVVWIYTAVKVGSITLCNSLEQCGIPNVHLHTMGKDLNYFPPHYLVGTPTPEYYYKDHELFLEHLKEKDSIRIITSVREPIARDMSHFFHGFWVPYSQWRDQTNEIYDDFRKMIDGVLKDVNQFQWFNKELKAALGVDVYAYPFDQDRGYGIIKKDNISILILKLEKLNTLTSVVREFLGAENFKLVNANESKNKPYRYMYEAFKKNVKLPQRYVDRYYKDNRYMNHFYSKDEQIEFLQKWNRHIIKD